ncbi:hypothetical protein HMI55_002723 [Coelomomyces lativittatus]|nr:hypothetical protein HMI55_002723 [Coelomomyces lativittatus]
MEPDPSLRPLTFSSQLLEHAPSHLDTLFQTFWELQQIHQSQPNYLELHSRLHALTARLMHFTMSLSPELKDYIVLPFASQKDTPDWLHTRLSNDILQLEEQYIQSAKRQISLSSSSSRKKRRLGLFRGSESLTGVLNNNSPHDEKLFQALQTQVSTHDSFVLQALEILKDTKKQYEKSIFEPYEELGDAEDDDLEMDEEVEKIQSPPESELMESQSAPAIKSSNENADQNIDIFPMKADTEIPSTKLEDTEDEEDDEDVEEEEEEEEEEEIAESKELESNRRKQRWTLAHLPDPINYNFQLAEAVRFLHSGPVRL